VNAGYAGRMRWSAARDPQEVKASLTGRAPLAALREIGRRGDVVVGWKR